MSDSAPEPVEPINAEQARSLLYQAIRDRLGEHWDDEETGWRLVTGHDYMARLTRAGAISTSTSICLAA
ncbi:MAG: hypothetical protein UZ13_02089 [Chloroflexi bacterium OLB13]|nr:MAG: hypothetical protein UZ13_02089 [Chloroflexi bacterium OLB13]